MNEIIKKVIKYKETMDDIYFESIIDQFIPYINCYLKKVAIFYQEDLFQEILIAIHKVLINFKLYDYSKTNIDIKYIKLFLETIKTNKLIINYNRKEILKEYNLFCNQNQLIYYIKKRITSTYIDFINSKYYKYNFNKISLNKLNEEENEFIDMIIDISTIKYITIFDIFDFSIDELNFLINFLEKGKFLTEKEVAYKLGISQQAVNKRKKQIIEKYKKTSC